MSLESVGRQFKLEAEAARLGAQRLRADTLKHEQQGFASGSLWGRSLINQQFANIAETIKATQTRLTQGKAQTGAISLQDVFNQVDFSQLNEISPITDIRSTHVYRLKASQSLIKDVVKDAINKQEIAR